MNRSIPSLVAGAALGLILVAYMVTYQLRFTEVAVVRTFGRATKDDVRKEPGLYFKWPWPIQRVSFYDNRIQLTVTTGEEAPTRDNKNVIVTTAVGWRVDDPYTFSIRCADMADAAGKLQTRVRNDQKTVLSRYDFANLVSTDETELRYDRLEQEILEAVAPAARELYGIRVESVGIEKLALPQRITETVFEAMKKERQAVADQYISEGESTAKQIEDTAESIAGTILAFADRKAAEIVAEGERRAAQYNATFRQDPGLAEFLLAISNLTRVLKERTTIVVDGASPPFDQLLDTGGAGGRPAVPTTLTSEAPVLAPTPQMLENTR